MKQTEIFEGSRLHDAPISYPCSRADYRLSLCGIDGNGSQLYVPVDEELLSRHILIMGGIGTGKTNTFLQMIAQLKRRLSPQDIMIVFDTKGDFYENFYVPGDVVISNDELACGSSGRDYWNIFHEIPHDNSAYENIAEIAKSLFLESIQNTNQPFFPNAAKDIFCAVMMHFYKNRKTMTCSNHSLKSFFSGASVAEIKEILEKNSESRYMINYISNEKSAQTQGVLSELYQVLNSIFISNFNKEGSLSMRRLVHEKGGKCVFVEYDLGIGNMLSPVYSLLMDMAIKEALCRKKSDGNVYFIVDEFSLLPYLQHIEDAVNFGRSLGVKFMIGIQNISQIYNAYGSERAQSILSGFLTNIAFNVNDHQSREFIKNFYGKNRKKEIYMGALQSKGVVESVYEGNVIEDWDISHLQRGEAIIGFPSAEPFRFRFSRYSN